MGFMKDLKSVLNNQYNSSITENGAEGYASTGKALMDIHFQVSSLRNESEQEIIRKFALAFYENRILAIKWLFFAGDVRYGLGERRLFRICIKDLAENHKELTYAVMKFIPEYSRWDNLFCLIGTPLQEEAIEMVIKQIEQDETNMKSNKPISLCAKWMPSINASCEETKKLARMFAKKMGKTQKQYRHLLSELREYLKIVEVFMSKKEWSKIIYSQVPSRANLIYRNAFLRNDEVRRKEYLKSLQKGKEVIHAGVLFPHDIVHNYFEEKNSWELELKEEDAALEELWKALPDYVGENNNTLCVADGSGSMRTIIRNTNITCLDVANALAIYFAERCSGQFKNQYITFSQKPQLVNLGGENISLRDKIRIAILHNEIANTNIEAVFDLILETAIQKKMSQQELPKNILILSDMEFDSCVVCNKNNDNDRKLTKKLFEELSQRYTAFGYQLPRLIFWNICSRTATIPVKENKLGVALVSGFSPNILNMVLSQKADPWECLLQQLQAERYHVIEEAVKNVF